MQKHHDQLSVATTDELAGAPEKYHLIRRLVRDHPYWSVLLFFAYVVIVIRVFEGLFLLIGLFYQPSFLLQEFLFEPLLGILSVILPLSILGWWNSPAFRNLLTWPPRIRGRKALYLAMFFLFFLIPLTALPMVIHQASLLTVMMAVVLCLCVGFAEEGICRGLMMNILLPRGIWTSLLLSAFLFACLHIFNIFAGFPWTYVLGQVLLAMGFGFYLGAVRLRTDSLRPGIISHAIWDLAGIIMLATDPKQVFSVSATLSLIVGGVICVLFFLFTLIVLRPKKLAALRVMYGLVPALSIPHDAALPPDLHVLDDAAVLPASSFPEYEMFPPVPFVPRDPNLPLAQKTLPDNEMPDAEMPYAADDYDDGRS